MRRLNRALVGAVVFAATTMMLLGSAEAQTPTPVPVQTDSGVNCLEGDSFSCTASRTTYTVYGDVIVAVTVPCNADETVPCWRISCDTHLDGDGRPFGMAWNNNENTRPELVALLPLFGEQTLEQAATDWAATYVGDPGAPGRPGWFSETGSWWRCGEVNVQLDQADQLSPANRNPSNPGFTYGPQGGGFNMFDLRDNAETRAEPGTPPIDKAPPVGTGATAQLPAWFWVEDSYWQNKIGVDTSPRGRMTVTVTATPEETTWDTGEGTTVVCTDAGTQWVSGMDPYTDSNCSHTFQDSSSIMSSGFHRIEATSRFSRTWSVTLDGGTTERGPMTNDYTATSGWDVVVDEILSVAVSPRGPSVMEQLVQNGQGG